MRKEELVQKVKSLETRVAVLEQHLKKQMVNPVSSHHDPRSPQESGLEMNLHQHNLALDQPGHQQSDPTMNSPKVTEKKEMDWEKQLGQVWLPRVFIFVLLIGLIWGFKAAVDYGLLAPPIRIVIGFLFGALVYRLGERQIKQERRILGIVLLGGAVVTMMITTFAMQVLYQMVPSLPAMGLNLIWIISGFFLSFRHKTESLGVLVGIGGYLIPFLVHSHHPSIYGFASFEFIMYMGFFLIAIKQNYRILFHVSNYLLHFSFLATVALSGFNPHSEKVLASFILAQFAIMTGLYFYKTFFNYQFTAMYALAVLTSGWLAGAFSKPMVLSILAIGVVVYGIGFILTTRNKNQFPEKQHVTLTIASYFLAIWFVNYFAQNHSALYLSFLVEGVLMVQLGLRLMTKLHQILGVVLVAVASLGILTKSYTHFWSFKILVLFIFAVSFGVLYALFRKEGIKVKVLASGIAYVAAILFFLTFSTQSITHGMSDQIKNVSLSCVWGVFAFLSVAYGQLMKNRKIRVFGIAAIFVVLVKVITHDIAGLSTTVRALLFIALGIVGIVMSRIFYMKRNDRTVEK